MNTELANFLSAAAATAAKMGRVVNSIEYGTVKRLATYMGHPRIAVVGDSGECIVIAAEVSTGRYYVEVSTGGVADVDFYLTGTAALMARDAIARS